jgi:hypothetical protein
MFHTPRMAITTLAQTKRRATPITATIETTKVFIKCVKEVPVRATHLADIASSRCSWRSIVTATNSSPMKAAEAPVLAAKKVE